MTPWASFRADVAADYARYDRPWAQPGWYVGLSYRVRRFRRHGPRYAQALLPVDFLFGCIRRRVADTRIPSDTHIGPGLLIVHARGIRISPMAMIGPQFRIFNQVTIGQWRGLAPIIGAGVTIYPGARVLGPILIGSCSRIGPNCVVTRSVPPGTVARVPNFVTHPLGASHGR